MRNTLKSPRTAMGIASLALACAFIATPAFAALGADATLSSTELSPTSWQYSVTLTDVGTTNIGSFWLAWIPGQDYMPTSPTGITSASAWSALVTGGNPGNGYAIQWVAGTGESLTPGQSTSFSFDSASTPQQLAGNSPFYSGTPTLTSFVYSGAPFSDAGYEFVVQSSPVPEPSTTALLAVGALLLTARALRARSGARA